MCVTCVFAGVNARKKHAQAHAVRDVVAVVPESCHSAKSHTRTHSHYTVQTQDKKRLT